MNYIGLNSKQFETQVSDMNKLLSSYQVYYQNLRSFHWHIKGENFFELHTKFEEYYNSAKLNIDAIAERIQTLGFKPIGNMSTYLMVSEISEAPDELEDYKMVELILDNHIKLLSLLRSIVNSASRNDDHATEDLFIGYIKELEKKSWQLNAWNKKSIQQLIS
jgi:starvation-inducible DNA-binding protein